MKVLLVQSSLGIRSAFTIWPIGLASLAASLHEHEVRILDLNIVTDRDGTLQRLLAEFSPDVVGISLRNIDDQSRANFSYYYREYFQDDVEKIRQLAGAHIPFIVGGPGFSLFPVEILEQNPGLDFGVYLDGEKTLPLLLANLNSPQQVKGVYYREGEQIKFSGQAELPDFDALPPPRRDLVDLKCYPKITSVGVQTKRGCGLNCDYCAYPFLSGKKIRLRDPVNVADEIENLVNVHGVKRFFIADTIFTIPIVHARQICEELIRRELPIEWGAYIDMKLADESFWVLAKRAGCRIFMFSPDGYSDEALMGLNKGLTKRQVDDHVRRFLSHKDMADVEVIYTFMMNPPNESLIGLLSTLIMFLKLKITLRVSRRGNVSLSWIRIEPKTKLFDVALRQGDVANVYDLLPERGGDLERIFYRHPKLYLFDYLVLFLRRLIKFTVR